MSQQNQSWPQGSPWGPGNQGARPDDAAWQRPEAGEPSGYAQPQGNPDAWQQPSAGAPGTHHPPASGAQPPSGQAQHDPYGQVPYGPTPYGQPPYDQPSYGGAQHGQTPYGQTPYGRVQHGQAQYDPPQSPYRPSPYAPQQHPGQGWNVPAQPKRPVWKLVVGIVLAAWTAMAVLSTMSRLGNVVATASGRGAAYQAGTLIGLLLMIVVPGVLAWLLLRRKR